jgi:hypothetical protein
VKQGVEETNSEKLKLKVKSPPSQGKANREVIEVLANYFRLPPSRIRIVRGQKSRSKLVLLEVEDKELFRFNNKEYIKEG